MVVGTCPDLGTIQPIQPPLRWLARRWSRQLAAAQTVATVEAGGRTVSLGDLLGPRFAAAPQRMFGDDRFHPSAEGYRAAAEVVLPSALAALGVDTAVTRAAAGGGHGARRRGHASPPPARAPRFRPPPATRAQRAFGVGCVASVPCWSGLPLHIDAVYPYPP